MHHELTHVASGFALLEPAFVEVDPVVDDFAGVFIELVRVGTRYVCKLTSALAIVSADGFHWFIQDSSPYAGRAYDSASTACRQVTEENKFTQQYLELYKLAVEMADRVSARRATANAFFLTVNTALLAFVSSGLDDMLWLVALAGIALSGTWSGDA